jgi:hypothetical protein
MNILRSEHLLLQEHLYGDWQGYKAFKGKLIPWEMEEKLDSQVDNIWVKKKRRDIPGPSRFCS